MCVFFRPLLLPKACRKVLVFKWGLGVDRVRGASSRRVLASVRAFATCSGVSSRRCAVGIGDAQYLARRVVWPFRVAGIGNRGHVGVALARGLMFRVGRGGRACYDMGIVDVHFAWQALDSGCMSPLRKALHGGSAWQVWGIVRSDTAQRASRTRAALHHVGREWCDLVRCQASFCVAAVGNRSRQHAAAETAGFRGPVREIGCVRARQCVSRVAKSWPAQGIC